MSALDKKARQIVGNAERLNKQSNLDRNTLYILYLLLKEKSVTRTAMMVGQSQPAVSETLARLRTMTGDKLLVRSGGKLQLTEHAKSLQQHVERALLEIDWIRGRQGEFDPARAQRVFRVATADNLDLHFHVGLVREFRRLAPLATLETFALTRDYDYARELADGSVDVVVANWPEAPGHLRSRPMLETRIVCIMSAKHRWAKVPLTWEKYQSVEHIDITPRALGEVSPIDVSLLKQGLHRRILAHYPFFSLIPAIVAESDLVFTGGHQFLQAFARQGEIVLREMPGEMPPIKFYQLWHERTHLSVECTWFRQMLFDVVAQIR